MEEQNNNYDIRSLILSAIDENNNIKFLEKCYFIYESQGLTSESTEILLLLEDDELTRRIRQLDALIEETENKIFYYEEDHKSPPKLFYKAELEKKLRFIRNEQLSILAKLLSEINQEEEITL